MLIDTHAHLTDPVYGSEKQIVADMEKDGLERIITVGYDMESSLGGYRIARENEAVYCAVGFHPSDVGGMKDGDIDTLLEISRSEKCVAIGEIGLDYHYPDTNKKQQWEGLDKMFDLVFDSALPVVFHVRDADGDMLEKVKKNVGKFKAGGVVHCFSGSLETAKQYIDLGFYISFTGAITFGNARKFPDIIKNLPLERILIETDCPYLTPVPHRGEVNYPKYVKYQAAHIADILGKSAEEIADVTRENAYRLFTKMKRRQIIEKG